MSGAPKYCAHDADGSLWFREALAPSVGAGYRVDRLIHEAEEGDQHILVFENDAHGRMLVIDGLVQLSQSDEFVYHEMVTHPALFAHGAVNSVLVVGGGDGGVMREVLRHKSVDRVVLVEIDKDVVDFSKRWLPDISAGAFEDQRVEVIIADGVDYMASGGEAFDLIIIDSSDPVGPSAVLFTQSFYASCKTRLSEGGVLVTQSGLVSIHPEVIADTSRYFTGLFANHGFIAITVPVFAGGQMLLGFATDARDTMNPPDGVLENRVAEAGLVLQQYSAAAHRAAFALPPRFEALLTR
jgi:spermidine synthase